MRFSFICSRIYIVAVQLAFRDEEMFVCANFYLQVEMKGLGMYQIK